MCPISVLTLSINNNILHDVIGEIELWFTISPILFNVDLCVVYE